MRDDPDLVSPRQGPSDGAPAGLWTHLKGGFNRDGRFATLLDVVNHYDSQLGLHLSARDKSDLVEYLKSL